MRHNKPFKIFDEDQREEILNKLQSDEAKNLVKRVKQLSEEEREELGTFEITINTDDEDRVGEVVLPDGADIENYMKNPVVLWGHNHFDLPVAVTEEIVKEGDALIARGVFAPEEVNPKAQEIRRAFDMGFVNAASVGFIPKAFDEDDRDVITEWELLEWSFVSIPANPEALGKDSLEGKVQGELVRKGLMFDPRKKTVPQHQVSYRTADRDRGWSADAAIRRLRIWASSDGSGEKDKVDFSQYKEGFGWFDSDEPEEFGSYKLPHLDIVDDDLSVVFSGVVALLSALNGARGGVDISEEERQGVYEVHVVPHYEEFDEEAPDLKSIEDMEAKEVFEEAGLEFSNQDEENVKLFIDQLKEIYGEKEESNPAPLTVDNLENCARCGGSHEGLEFKELDNPVEDLTHWAKCPETEEPIMLKRGDLDRNKLKDVSSESLVKELSTRELDQENFEEKTLKSLKQCLTGLFNGQKSTEQAGEGVVSLLDEVDDYESLDLSRGQHNLLKAINTLSRKALEKCKKPDEKVDNS